MDPLWNSEISTSISNVDAVEYIRTFIRTVLFDGTTSSQATTHQAISADIQDMYCSLLAAVQQEVSQKDGSWE